VKLVATSLVLALLAIGLLALPAGPGLDRLLVERAVQLDSRIPGLDPFMKLGTEIGRPTGILLGLFLPAAFGGAVARATARGCFVSLAANQATVSALKWLTNRPRPEGGQTRANSSFPSAHAAAAAGAAWIIAARHRRLAPWAWMAALWISSSRVFLGRHHPSDVLAGALIGILFAALTLKLGGHLAWGSRNGGA
jgi:undecaprenyl-diphosphatase